MKSDMQRSEIKLINDDCRKIAFYPDKSINLIFTSPPYNIGTRYKDVSDSLSFNEYYNFLFEIVHLSTPKLKTDGYYSFNVADTVFCGKYAIFMPKFIQGIMNKNGFYLYSQILWKKSPSMKVWDNYGKSKKPTFHSPTEWILTFSHSSPSMSIPVEFLEIEKQRNYKSLHPAIFPEELVKIVINKFTKEHDTVCDLFMGIGTTAVVCKKLKRNFIGYELSKEYIKIAKHHIGRM